MRDMKRTYNLEIEKLQEEKGTPHCGIFDNCCINESSIVHSDSHLNVSDQHDPRKSTSSIKASGMLAGALE